MAGFNAFSLLNIISLASAFYYSENSLFPQSLNRLVSLIQDTHDNHQLSPDFNYNYFLFSDKLKLFEEKAKEIKHLFLVKDFKSDLKHQNRILNGNRTMTILNELKYSREVIEKVKAYSALEDEVVKDLSIGNLACYTSIKRILNQNLIEKQYIEKNYIEIKTKVKNTFRKFLEAHIIGTFKLIYQGCNFDNTISNSFMDESLLMNLGDLIKPGISNQTENIKDERTYNIICHGFYGFISGFIDMKRIFKKTISKLKNRKGPEQHPIILEYLREIDTEEHTFNIQLTKETLIAFDLLTMGKDKINNKLNSMINNKIAKEISEEHENNINDQNECKSFLIFVRNDLHSKCLYNEKTESLVKIVSKIINSIILIYYQYKEHLLIISGLSRDLKIHHDHQIEMCHIYLGHIFNSNKLGMDISSKEINVFIDRLTAKNQKLFSKLESLIRSEEVRLEYCTIKRDSALKMHSNKKKEMLKQLKTSLMDEYLVHLESYLEETSLEFQNSKDSSQDKEILNEKAFFIGKELISVAKMMQSELKEYKTDSFAKKDKNNV